MGDDNTGGFLVLRIVPIFFLMSIGLFVGVGEYLLASGTAGPWLTPIIWGRDFQVLHIVISVLGALMVALAVAMKRAVVGGSLGGMRAVVKALMRNSRRREGGTGIGVVLVPLALSEGVAVLGFMLFVIGGGERLLCYPFYGAALLSLITALPNSDYLSKAASLDEEVRKEMQRL